MNIAVIGTGYVGLVTGVCFSEMGNNVICADINKAKIEKLSKGILPIYEPGLKELLDDNLEKSITFTVDVKKAIEKSDVVFIAVGTPMNSDGDADLSAVFSVADLIGSVIDNYKIIITKSTVPVGTTKKVKELIQNKVEERKVKVTFDVASNPEFLKEGAAVSDFMKPDRVVIGAETESVFKTLRKLYAPFFRTRDRFIEMDIASSEMTKYAANAMLATKISFINEIANICEVVGANVNDVRIGIGSDSRIGYNFIYPGIGYGGTCFPKDISALIKVAEKNGYNPKLISSVDEVNQNQRRRFVDKIVNRFAQEGLRNKKIAVWGLAFKPETDDIRQAPALDVIKNLIEKGAIINGYDPKAIKNTKEYFKENRNITFEDDKYKALENADALILLTEWKEFRSPNFDEIKSKMKQSIIFDGRNQYKSFDLQEKGFEYYQIGVK